MTMTGFPQPASDPKLRAVAPSQSMPPGLLAAIYPYCQRSLKTRPLVLFEK